MIFTNGHDPLTVLTFLAVFMSTILNYDLGISFFLAFLLFSTNLNTTNSDPVRSSHIENEFKEKGGNNNFVHAHFNFPNSTETEINEPERIPINSHESCIYPRRVSICWFSINCFLDNCECESSDFEFEFDGFHNHQTANIRIPGRIDPIER